jgi:hypothetical protein
MVGLGNKYPRQLLNSAVHKVLFSDSTVIVWIAFGKKIPRSEIVFLCQVLILYTVICSQHLITFGQYQYVFLVMSIREQYPDFVYAYVVPTVRILYLRQSYLPGSIQI